MGERDAFGREIGEDPLASLGWKPSGAEPPAATPAAPPTAFDAGEVTSPFARAAPVAEPSAPTAFTAGEAAAPFSRPKPRPAAPKLTPPPRRRGGPSVARLGIAIVVLGILAIGVSKAVEVGGDAVDGIRDRIESLEPKPAAPSPSAPGSLLRAGPLEDALAKLPAGRLVLVRISADSLDAQVIRAGRRHTVHLSTTGPNAEVTTPAGAAQRGFKLNPKAPLRAARGAARRAGLSVDDLSYMVATERGWSLFFTGGAQYRATLSGRRVTKA